MPGPGRAAWPPPSAITTSSGGCGSGHLTAGRPNITAAIVRHVCSGGHTGHGAARRWRGIAGLADALPAAASCWCSRGTRPDVGCLDAGRPIASASVRPRRTGPWRSAERQVPLVEHSSRARRRQRNEIGDRARAALLREADQRQQHLGGGLRVRQCAMTRLHRRAEEIRELGELRSVSTRKHRAVLRILGPRHLIELRMDNNG